MLKMPRIHWKSTRIIGVILAAVLCYLTIRIKTYEHKAFVFLLKTHPNEAWEFVADFSNMKFLNPTITSFEIIEETGNYEHWKYTIEYSEKLSHWPYLPNHARAFFNVKAGPKKDAYYIDSVHITCLFNNFFCLNSESKFKFSHANKSEGAICEENISYQCPAFLSPFCKREVVFQRNAIMNNLQRHFANNRKM